MPVEERAMTSERGAGRPLTGLRAVEATGEIATRYCGRLLSRLGANVVQVGDRSADPVNQVGEAARAYNAWLDEGKQIAPDLQTALASVEGARGPVLVIAGQTPDDVRAVDRALAARPGDFVRVGVTWFGEDGPYAGWRGNDAVILALSGLAFGFGLPEGPPTLAQGHAPQVMAGLNAFIGGLAALMAGPDGPTHVDVNVLEAALCFTEPGTVAAHADPLAQSTRLGVNRFNPLYPASVYKTTDGHVGVTTLTPAQWSALVGLIGKPELAADPRFATSAERTVNGDAIDEFLIPLIAQKPTDYWVEAGIRLRIPITPAPRPRDLPKLPHWRDRGSFDDYSGTGAQGPALPFRFKFDGVTAPRPEGGPRGPLEGVKVADFSMGWAGPLAARYFADLGADVLKIESTARPDWWRGWEIVEAQDPPLHELPRHFMAVNRSKRGVDIDLLSDEGRKVAETIIRRADLVIENHGPGVMDKLSLGQADQRRLHPGVVSVSMPPFGHGGPLSGLRAYGSTVEHASGLPFVNGHADWTPCMQHTAYGDPVAGIYAAAAAIAGLYGRPAMGGAEIDLCQVECVFQLGADAIIGDQVTGIQRTGSRRAAMAPVCVVKGAGEEAWLAVAVDTDAAWRALCGRLEDASVSEDWGLAERQANADAIEAAIARWAKDRPPAEAAERLQAFGVPAGPVHPAHSLWRNEHLVGVGYWTTLNRRYIGEHIVPHPPIRFDGARPAPTRPAPVLGEHSLEALAELTDA
jgi:crotonobetainyl-CoA:carnitine CoA-transferase CaiB-like acyl-CoA transferase